MKVLKYICLSLLVVLILGSCASAEVRAVRKGDVEEIRKFLADGGDPNTVYDDGNALIHIAVLSGQTASLDTLLQAGANANLKNSAGNTAAILAAGANRRDMIDLLLKYGADMRTAGRGGVTTLMLASSKGNVSLMDILLKLGVPVNGQDDKGRSAIFYSISAPDAEALAFLLNSGADASMADKENRTPLHDLTQNRQKAYALLLVDRGTDLQKTQNSTGETALHKAAGSAAWELVELYLSRGAGAQINSASSVLGAPLFYAMKENLPPSDSLKTMEILLGSGSDPNQVSASNVSPIVHAVEKLDIPRVELLISRGANVNIPLPEERNLLHRAVFKKSPQLVSLLLDYNMNPDSRDIYGKTPLYYAVEQNDKGSLEVLLANGSSPNMGSSEGINPLYLSLERDANTPSLSEMTSLLLRYGALLPREKEKLSQLLLKSVRSGNSGAVDLLLQSGADAGAADRQGVSALMVSSNQKTVDISELLLFRGARTNALDSNGNTALHYASGAGSVAGVELLLRFQAEPDPVNYNNTRPVEMAPKNAQGERIVEILLAAGAKPLPVVTPEPVPEVVPEPEPEPVTEPESVPETVPETEVQPEAVAPIEPEAAPVPESEPLPESPVSEEPEADDDNWPKARILTLGEEEPRRISRGRKTFPGYSASVPESFPRSMYSKFNNQDIKLFIRNETSLTAEVYIVNSDGKTDAIASIAPGDVLELGTWQGNYYPVYSANGSYFGNVQTTGQREQYYRLVN